MRKRLLAAGMGIVAMMGAIAQGPDVTAAGCRLAALEKGDVVVFQGDSITDGGRQRTGSDYNHIMGQDYAYILSAEIGATYPERELTFVNRGIGGNRVVDLAGRWEADTLEVKPKFLSILIGVNDTLAEGERAETVETYEAVYDKLLADTIAGLPGVKIVIGEPFLLPVGKHVATYTAELGELKKRQAVVMKLAAKYQIPVVMYQEAFNAALKRAPAEHWTWDGVHPTYAGHWLMSREWKLR